MEYLGRIECDFQKSRVTAPWDHKILVSAKKVKKKIHACVPLRMYTTCRQSYVSDRHMRFFKVQIIVF